MNVLCPRRTLTVRFWLAFYHRPFSLLAFKPLQVKPGTVIAVRPTSVFKSYSKVFKQTEPYVCMGLEATFVLFLFFACSIIIKCNAICYAIQPSLSMDQQVRVAHFFGYLIKTSFNMKLTVWLLKYAYLPQQSVLLAKYISLAVFNVCVCVCVCYLFRGKGEGKSQKSIDLDIL